MWSYACVVTEARTENAFPFLVKMIYGCEHWTRRSANIRVKEIAMAKAYWVSCYRSIRDPEALAAYAKLAGPAISAAGGRFLARGIAAKAYEAGLLQRIVLIEFDSVAAAIACHDGPGYQAALKLLNNAAERDLRIVEGVE